MTWCVEQEEANRRADDALKQRNKSVPMDNESQLQQLQALRADQIRMRLQLQVILRSC
jgi:hypothetical protein